MPLDPISIEKTRETNSLFDITYGIMIQREIIPVLADNLEERIEELQTNYSAARRDFRTLGRILKRIARMSDDEDELLMRLGQIYDGYEDRLHDIRGEVEDMDNEHHLIQQYLDEEIEEVHVIREHDLKQLLENLDQLSTDINGTIEDIEDERF
uniref:Uncharacterized protein n=1 Tax=Acrobeloides nanus TaxID=290746 RepID=A0A914C3H3_9BILA